jgi:hypothetical protein
MRKETTLRVTMVSRHKASFWPDDSTIPGNYGCDWKGSSIVVNFLVPLLFCILMNLRFQLLQLILYFCKAKQITDITALCQKLFLLVFY